MPPLHYLLHLSTSIRESSFHIGSMTPRNTPLLLLKNSKALHNVFLQHRQTFQQENIFKIFLKIFDLTTVFLSSVFLFKENTVNVLIFSLILLISFQTLSSPITASDGFLCPGLNCQITPSSFPKSSHTRNSFPVDLI